MLLGDAGDVERGTQGSGFQRAADKRISVRSVCVPRHSYDVYLRDGACESATSARVPGQNRLGSAECTTAAEGWSTRVGPDGDEQRLRAVMWQSVTTVAGGPLARGLGLRPDIASVTAMPPSWTSDEELFARARRELFSAVIGDTLDLLGHRQQFLPPEIQPLRDDMVVVGRAMPVLEADDEVGKAQTRAGELPKSPFGLMLRALDDLKPGEV